MFRAQQLLQNSKDLADELEYYFNNETDVSEEDRETVRQVLLKLSYSNTEYGSAITLMESTEIFKKMKG